MNRITTLSIPRGEPGARGGPFAVIWATIAGLLVPFLIVLVGLIAALLNGGALVGTETRLGTHLTVTLPERLVEQSELVQLSWLVGVALVAAVLFSVAVWFNRSLADRRARRVVKDLHGRLFRQSQRRAEFEGATAQYVRAEKLIGEHLPAVQSGLSMWYRVIPRSVLMLLGCVVVAVLVNVWLTVLAVISGVLVWRLFRKLRAHEPGDLAYWEVPRSRQRMAELVGRAPLLARLQTQGNADRAFESELESLYRRLATEDARRGRVWPLLFLASAVAIAVLLLGLGVNLLGVEKGLSLPAALVLGLSLTAAAISAGRLAQLAGQLRASSESSETVYHYLQRGDEVSPSEQRVGLAGLREAVDIRDVTLRDSTGQELLSHLSLRLCPGSLVALLGTDPIPTRALTELLMGFGRPVEGRVEIDGLSLLDVHPQALARNVMWVEPGGPIWDGTILENLRGGETAIGNSDIRETLERVGVYEQIQRLPEGLQTIVAAGDTALGVEQTYAIGIARAILHRPSIVLAIEPPPPAEHLSVDPCLAALRQLATTGSLVILLPHRLSSLREADRVVLFNGPRLVGEGRHQELLGGSDLYRHLNYLLFNPYRHQSQPTGIS